MIVVDTSALIEILIDGPEARRCMRALAEADAVLISAGTLAEAHIVAGRRGIRPALRELVGRLAFEVVPLTASQADAVGDAYDRWGRGAHPAGLNFGDCFGYALARERGIELLFVGVDFTRTDIERA